jgi:hypothetical protein
MNNGFTSMRGAAVALAFSLAASLAAAAVDVSVQIAVPGASIGIHTPRYPAFVQVPYYPVYYAPQQQANLFFYDGLYWAYQRDHWYASTWYDGPWRPVGAQAVPLYVLRVPVRYYRDPPNHFRSWQRDAPPRWGEHWGNEWSQQHVGWDRWDRRARPLPAPLPTYQRRYAGDRYPQAEVQQTLHNRNYRYESRDQEVRQQQRADPGRGNGKGRGRDKDRDDDDQRGNGRKK